MTDRDVELPLKPFVFYVFFVAALLVSPPVIKALLGEPQRTQSTHRPEMTDRGFVPPLQPLCSMYSLWLLFSHLAK